MGQETEKKSNGTLWLMIIVGTGLWFLDRYSLLPRHFIFQYGVNIGFSLQLILLSLGIGAKVNRLGMDLMRRLERSNTELEEKVAALENGRAAVATSTGHAAQMLAMYILMEPGANFVSSKNPEELVDAINAVRGVQSVAPDAPAASAEPNSTES